MKTPLLVFFLVCSALLSFGQRNGRKMDTGTKWIPGRIAMNNGTAHDLDLDTTLVSGGFPSLNVVAVTDNPDDFKFERDKFSIPVINDFQLHYLFKEGFKGRAATFTLYIYSGKMIIYKKKYSIMFDGTRHPKLLMLGG